MKLKNPPADFDGAWKDAWKLQFRLFLEAYFPDIAETIDWSIPCEWLDKEIEKIIGHSGKTKGKRVDLLVRVTLKDGSKSVLLLHIEIQNTRDDGLPDRVHTYWSGLHFHTGEKVITLVVLADLDKDWRPDKSVFQFGSFKSEIHFSPCKLLDLDLENPALRGIPYEVARAQLAALRTANDPVARYKAKKDLLLGLYQCGYTADDVRDAYGLIDHMMFLSESLRKKLNQEIEEFESEIDMPYVTSMEQHFVDKGIERVAKNMITSGKSDEEIVELTELTLEQVRQLRIKVADSEEK